MFSSFVRKAFQFGEWIASRRFASRLACARLNVDRCGRSNVLRSAFFALLGALWLLAPVGILVSVERSAPSTSIVAALSKKKCDHGAIHGDCGSCAPDEVATDLAARQSASPGRLPVAKAMERGVPQFLEGIEPLEWGYGRAIEVLFGRMPRIINRTDWSI